MAAYAVAMLVAFGFYRLVTRPEFTPKKASESTRITFAKALTIVNPLFICYLLQ